MPHEFTGDRFLWMPKAEIHVHLEGSVLPADLQELARRNHLPDASWPLEAFEAKYHYADFLGFLQSFKFVTEHFIQPQDYGWIAARLIERLHAVNILYAEVFFSAGVVLKQNKDLDAITTSITTASREMEHQLGLRVNWIFDVTRQFGPGSAAQVVEAAIRLRRSGMENIVAVGMGGDENSVPAVEFAPVFGHARDHGLHVTIHAGEVAGPRSIWEALELLGAERIGHGIAASQDERLMDHLKENDVPLECAPTSNVCTGAIPGHQENPLAMFFRRGLRVTLNTDDPALFHTDLVREYEIAARHFGFTWGDFARMNQYALEGSFASEPQKRELEQRFRECLEVNE
jgi:adenosine deaminase/aminodeoxyfutalosine deaminase